MASTGSKIYSSDYNAVQVKVRTVLGDGYPYGVGTSYPDYGYGATLLSSPVTNTREYTTSTLTTDISTGSTILTLSRITGSKIGKVVKAPGIVDNSIITAINTVTSSITINNTTTDMIAAGSQIDVYYNSNIVITKQQWQNLEDDINTINKHQFNTNFAGYGTITGKINASNLTALNTIIDNLTLTRSAVDAGQLTLDPFIAEKTAPFQWGGPGDKGIQSISYVTFNSAKEMQSFFNSGGEISFGGEGPNLVNPQDTAWYNLLNNAFVNTSARFTRTEFARIGPVPFQWYQVEDGNPPYELNTISITAQKFSNYIGFVVKFRDGHVPIGGSPLDYVSPGAGYKIYQKRATGAFTGIQPSGVSVNNFTIF